MHAGKCIRRHITVSVFKPFGFKLFPAVVFLKEVYNANSVVNGGIFFICILNELISPWIVDFELAVRVIKMIKDYAIRLLLGYFFVSISVLH